jgi:hypothetical protein
VALVTERFEDLAHSVARARGKNNFPIVVWPANVEELSEAELRALADRTFDDLVSRLTKLA